MKPFFLPTLLSLLIAGCATTQSIPTEDRSRTYDAPKDTVVTAVANTFIGEGFTIASIDREVGIVTTGTRSSNEIKSALIGQMERQLQANVRSVDSSTSRLVLTLVYERENAFGGTEARSFDEETAIDMYEDWFVKIEKRLQSDGEPVRTQREDLEPRIREALEEREVVEGMAPNHVREVEGDPKSTRKEDGQTIWYYGTVTRRTKIYFKDGAVVDIK